MRIFVNTIAFMLLFCCVSGQNKYTRKQLTEDLEVLKNILVKTNPVIADSSRERLGRVLSDGIKDLPWDSATGLTFLKYVFDLQLNAGYDAHASVTYQEQLFPESKAFFPVPIYILNDHFVVNSEKSVIPYGSIIKSINGVSTADILNKVLGKKSEANFIKHKLNSVFSAIYFIEYGGSDEFTITYNQNSNSVEEKTIACEPVTLKDAFALQNNAIYPLNKTIPNNLLGLSWEFNEQSELCYVQLQSFGFTKGDSIALYRVLLDSLFKNIQLKSVKVVILDVRDNGGGLLAVPGLLYSYLTDSIFYETHHNKMMPVKNIPLKYLKQINNQELLSESDARKKLYRLYDGAATKNGAAYRDLLYKREPSPYRFTGETILLTNGGTFSAAAYFAALFKAHQRGAIIGSATGGRASYLSAGHALQYELPNTKVRVALPLMYINFEGDFTTVSDDGTVLPDKQLSFEQLYSSFYNKKDWGKAFEYIP